jgi:hypothetical protein
MTFSFLRVEKDIDVDDEVNIGYILLNARTYVSIKTRRNVVDVSLNMSRKALHTQSKGSLEIHRLSCSEEKD